MLQYAKEPNNYSTIRLNQKIHTIHVHHRESNKYKFHRAPNSSSIAALFVSTFRSPIRFLKSGSFPSQIEGTISSDIKNKQQNTETQKWTQITKR